MSTIISKNDIKCAVFDLDGTLLNTIKTINHYLNFALLKNGYGSIDEATCLSFVGDGAVKLVQRVLAHLGVCSEGAFDRVFADYNTAYDADPYYLTEVYDGIIETLMGLRSEGVILAVLSNKPDFATRATVDRFFDGIFTAVSGAKEGVPLKPYPDSLLAMLSELGVRREETIFIGDSEQDILTARNASVGDCVSVTWGFRSIEQLTAAGAKRLIDNPRNLLDYILNKKRLP